MEAHWIKGISILRIDVSRIRVLGCTAVVLLLGVGCQSTMPRHANLELVNYSSTQSQLPTTRTERTATASVATSSTDSNESKINASLKPVVSSAVSDDAEYPLSKTVLSAGATSKEHWNSDIVLNPQNSDTSLHSQNLLPRHSPLLERLWDDQKAFYSPESVTLLGSGLVVGGLMANTSIDESIHQHFQGSVRGATSDDWFESLHASKELGNGLYMLPVFAGAWAASALLPDNKLVETSGRWGERSIRGFLVGAPPMIVLQMVTGGSRPTETDESSTWHPFRDNNGISGHAFMGSLPFITAAKMTNNRGLKVLFYTSSAITPLSRVNDKAHYPSQVALGWWMAYLAASSVDATDNPNARWSFFPYSTGDSSGMKAEYRF